MPHAPRAAGFGAFLSFHLLFPLVPCPLTVSCPRPRGWAPAHLGRSAGYCTGWGDPHYVTFDGLYYSHQGACTYVLVEEAVPTVDGFGVYVDNYHCDPRDRVSCPRTLIVRHETQEVRLETVQMAPMTVQVGGWRDLSSEWGGL
uniref:Intestinal mucin-like protein n=1 Tax=Camelus bactrianus TaxID=9837 RepID=A0A9W3FP35_CAMBA